MPSKKVSIEELLEAAQELGITAVSVSTCHARVENEKWPFSYKDNLFTPPEERTYDNSSTGWPAAWKLADMLNIHGGCGNTGQVQLKRGHELPEGVWEKQDEGWSQIG